MTAALPAPRRPDRYAVGLVCLGNICRSPMADVVLAQRVDEAGLAGWVSVDSCGTGDWHVGQPMDRRAAATLAAEGFDPSRHRARQVDAGWFATHDLLLAMDAANLRDLRALAATAPRGAEALAEGRVLLFRDLDPCGTGDVPDPYYGGDDGFTEVLDMVERTAAVLVDRLHRRLWTTP